MSPDNLRIAGTYARPITVVVCDDSPFMQRVIQQTCEETGDVVVVATCSTAADALAACRLHRPDVMTLDLELPDANGIDVIRAMREEAIPTRVLVVSSYTSSAASERAVAALTEGAVECMGKPGVGDSNQVFTDQLLECIRGIGGAPPVASPAPPRSPRRAHSASSDRLFVIGASTGGPLAVETVLEHLPKTFECPMVIVQHMPAGFSGAFARRLAQMTGRDIREAQDGDPLRPGTVLVAPSGSHIRIERGLVRLDAGAHLHGSRPSFDLALLDAAGSWGDRVTAVVLTGMGTDGARGAAAVQMAGGSVIAEHERTCTVYGMPRAVIEAGAADAVVPLDMVAACIVDEARR